MAGLVDSTKQKLNSAQIIAISLENSKSEYPPKLAMPAIMTEMSQKNSRPKQIGNTLFSTLVGGDGKGYFKAFNADTAANYVANSKQYCIWAKDELGMNMLVTEFKDPAISTLFHVIAKNPPMEGMGFKEYRTKSGGSRIVLNLGA